MESHEVFSQTVGASHATITKNRAKASGRVFAGYVSGGTATKSKLCYPLAEHYEDEARNKGRAAEKRAKGFGTEDTEACALAAVPVSSSGETPVSGPDGAGAKILCSRKASVPRIRVCGTRIPYKTTDTKLAQSRPNRAVHFSRSVSLNELICFCLMVHFLDVDIFFLPSSLSTISFSLLSCARHLLFKMRCARSIQSRWRGVLGRRAFLDHAATITQKAARGYLARCVPFPGHLQFQMFSQLMHAARWMALPYSRGKIKRRKARDQIYYAVLRYVRRRQFLRWQLMAKKQIRQTALFRGSRDIEGQPAIIEAVHVCKHGNVYSQCKWSQPLVKPEFAFASAEEEAIFNKPIPVDGTKRVDKWVCHSCKESGGSVCFTAYFPQLAKTLSEIVPQSALVRLRRQPRFLRVGDRLLVRARRWKRFFGATIRARTSPSVSRGTG